MNISPPFSLSDSFEQTPTPPDSPKQTVVEKNFSSPSSSDSEYGIKDLKPMLQQCPPNWDVALQILEDNPKTNLDLREEDWYPPYENFPARQIIKSIIFEARSESSLEEIRNPASTANKVVLMLLNDHEVFLPLDSTDFELIETQSYGPIVKIFNSQHAAISPIDYQKIFKPLIEQNPGEYSTAQKKLGSIFDSVLKNPKAMEQAQKRLSSDLSSRMLEACPPSDCIGASQYDALIALVMKEDPMILETAIIQYEEYFIEKSPEHFNSFLKNLNKRNSDIHLKFENQIFSLKKMHPYFFDSKCFEKAAESLQKFAEEKGVTFSKGLIDCNRGVGLYFEETVDWASFVTDLEKSYGLDGPARRRKCAVEDFERTCHNHSSDPYGRVYLYSPKEGYLENYETCSLIEKLLPEYDYKGNPQLTQKIVDGIITLLPKKRYS